MEDHRSNRGRHENNQKRVSFFLAALVTGFFFAFVLVMAFRPGWLTAEVSPETVEAPALVLTFAFLVSILAVMGGFSWWKGRQRDE